MPPAKKPSAKKQPARKAGASTKTGSMTASTRQQLERAAKRLESSLDQASDALKALGRDVGHGGHRSYKEISAALSALRRDAQKTNRVLVDDLGRLRAAVTPGRSAAKRTAAGRSTTAAKSAKATGAKAAASKSKATASKAKAKAASAKAPAKARRSAKTAAKAAPAAKAGRAKAPARVSKAR